MEPFGSMSSTIQMHIWSLNQCWEHSRHVLWSLTGQQNTRHMWMRVITTYAVDVVWCSVQWDYAAGADFIAIFVILAQNEQEPGCSQGSFDIWKCNVHTTHMRDNSSPFMPTLSSLEFQANYFITIHGLGSILEGPSAALKYNYSRRHQVTNFHVTMHLFTFFDAAESACYVIIRIGAFDLGAAFSGVAASRQLMYPMHLNHSRKQSRKYLRETLHCVV